MRDVSPDPETRFVPDPPDPPDPDPAITKARGRTAKASLKALENKEAEKALHGA